MQQKNGWTNKFDEGVTQATPFKLKRLTMHLQ